MCQSSKGLRKGSKGLLGSGNEAAQTVYIFFSDGPLSLIQEAKFLIEQVCWLFPFVGFSGYIVCPMCNDDFCVSVVHLSL